MKKSLRIIITVFFPTFSLTLHSFIKELTDHIKVKSSTREEEGTDFPSFFPSFIWAVRDFALQLKLDGRTITANEYLENALKHSKGKSLYIELFNGFMCSSYYGNHGCPFSVHPKLRSIILFPLKHREEKPLSLIILRLWHRNTYPKLWLNQHIYLIKRRTLPETTGVVGDNEITPCGNW